MKAVILDMYGVILKDNGDGFVTFVNRTFPELSRADIYSVWSRADLGLIRSHEIFTQLGYTGDIDAVEKEYLDTIEVNPRFYPFAEEIRKHCKLALLSNDSSEWSSYLRKRNDLERYFDAISVSGDMKMKKPDPAVYIITAEKLGCRPDECVFADDRKKNLVPASALGMDAVLFGTKDPSYTGKYVSDFKELLDHLGL